MHLIAAILTIPLAFILLHVVLMVLCGLVAGVLSFVVGVWPGKRKA